MDAVTSRTAVPFGLSILLFVAGCQTPPSEPPEPAPAFDRDATGVATAPPEPVAPPPQRPAWLEQLLASMAEPAAEADHADEVEDAPDAVEAPPASPASTPAPTGNTVAVAMFTNLNEQSAASDLGSALARAVAERLAAMEGLTVVGAADEVRFVIDGAIQKMGSMVRVTARVSETADGAVLRTVKVDGTVDELSQLREAVVAAVSASVEAVAATPTGDAAVASVATKVLAVLPFDDLGQQRSDVDLGTAIANAVAEQLAGVAGVTVVSTSSLDGVGWVVDGGIQRVGNAARVTARLLDVESGVVLSSVKVDGTTGDLADLQRRVGSTVAARVRAALPD